MAEFDESLLKFDSIILDENENPSNTETATIGDSNEINKTVPPTTEITPKCDLTFGETSQSLDSPNNEIAENDNQIYENKSDVLLQNVDEQRDLTVGETLQSSDTPNTETSEKGNQINENKSDILLQSIDEQRCSFAPSETSLSMTVTDNNIEIPEISSELWFDKLDKMLPDASDQITNNRASDSGIHDSENNIVEDPNVMNFADLILNISNNCGTMMTEFINEENDVQVKDEEFHDAVQFFKDPSSFTCLESAGSSNAPTEPLLARSSLYVNFDPLHAKFFSQPAKCNELQEIAEDDLEPEVPSDDNVPSDVAPGVVNKHLANVSSPRESIGNVLISFESPISSKETHSQADENKQVEPQKLYTEEELQQALKIQELTVQETFLKKQQDLELARSQKQKEMEEKIQEQHRLCSSFYCLLQEIVDVAVVLSEKEKGLKEKLAVAEKENDKLKEDLKTSVEDLQSVESTFSDFHKRYEQCKSMLKMYTQNESNLKQQLENLKIQLQEKEEMYKALQSRTQEMIDKANTEVANVKKTGDAQAAVLKAQLKKAEMKYSSLESDLKHVKIENNKLSSICDELMAKVSEA